MIRRHNFGLIVIAVDGLLALERYLQLTEDYLAAMRAYIREVTT